VIAVATHAHYDHVGCMHEFAERLVHPAESRQLAGEGLFASLLAADFPQDWRDQAAAEGYPLPDVLVTAVPWAGYDPASYTLVPAPPTGTIDEGDEVSLGDRTFTVLHTPGHSPGGISLHEEETGILFSGDAIYDDVLLDELPGSDIPDYLRTVRRLRDLVGVTIVHAGHGASFGPERLRELCDAYLALRG
jgi:glyoxylase-like metal-dependent hydrolase (beta-lactamase superfamily II)